MCVMESPLGYYQSPAAETLTKQPVRFPALVFFFIIFIIITGDAAAKSHLQCLHLKGIFFF